MAELNPDLLEQAKELNIEVTENATNEALQAAIDEVLAEDGKTPDAGQSVVAALRETYREVIGKNAFNGWDAFELQKRIDAVRPGGTPPTEPARRDPLDHDGNGKKGGVVAKTFAYRINRDFWDEAGDRHPKGEILDLTAEDAQDGLESGALSRVK